ncbi:Mu transposase C-terminal domain-containing protein [Vibrio parahaemolyticus]|uniref:Mu transposase C-terminal domain-containing protein n=1 Tax=Vibrio parahaemolyticus TaxID=670 RepID=UPI00111F5968|nr:Mu transposase C-terminal domain-containing protein [Vibrio parahaemolyticus]TOI68736.1 transposase [Vibrio parahaemolyticus]HBC3606945.1 Mu transposase C-terminal domain-containing protein [Vibrio parahaemolyticus]HCG5472052.1 Mu transposase C-terminal domain-containing protein [Vibrio parahaemolyticus]HCG5933519.1 Mu transposase C-terminal domain-containing protein [Vibrio parahaemolyticus]HCG7638107.1 Mu transposase C-terminal domain-containing protein [Vibrio parahaemolyticus]
MELPRNSVWSVNDSELLEDGLYRLLDIMLEVESIVLYPLSDTSTTAKPVAISLDGFIELASNHQAKISQYALPSYLLVDEDSVPENYIVKRDKNFELIKGLIVDREFIFDYATRQRSSYLTPHAKKVGTYSKALARLLSLYWRNGQDKMALLPAFSKSGGSGRERAPTTKPLGSPKQPRTIAIDRANTFIVSDGDKEKFKKALKKYYLKELGLTLAKTYDNLLKDSYSKEIKLAEACGRPPLVPTKKQFSYWRTKLFSKEQTIKQRTSENDYLRNKRGVLGSIIDRSYLPGSHFEIDATVADVHIVSELGSQYVLGRPTIYIVADRASRMIVGMHVSLYHASWRAARQALTNSFLPKSDYCKGFGIYIQDSEWPCAHIPKELVCDNGEMIGVQPKKALTPMTQLSFTPPYRPDCKGVVEKRFDIINKEVLHELPGTTRGGFVVRGHQDPRKVASYTLKEVTVEIIKAILEHNRSILDGLAFSSPLLIENDLAPSPLNYWKIHVVKHKHELQSANSDEVIARLLPPAEVSMTRSGIHFNGLYYSCSELEERDLASVARSSGQWRLEARVDENTTNHIYVRLDKNKGFIRCELLPRSRMFSNKSMFESDFIQDWLDSKKELAPISVASIDDHQHRQQVTRDAKKRNKNSEKMTFADKTKNVRQHRKDELAATTNVLTSESNNSALIEVSEAPLTGSKVIPLPKGRKRRTKGGKS